MVSMVVRCVFFDFVVLMIFLFLFDFYLEEIIFRNILYCVFCVLLGFDSLGIFVGVIISLKWLDFMWRLSCYFGFRFYGKGYFCCRMNYYYNLIVSF